ncbi:tRNA dimethylallyltransferase 1 [Echinicola pacifica]|uniref:tRNA dimethylallyltransferase n=2 Tax=Echinicola pacifica TaxID=346377 RepID=A0A918UPY4_9BACT|nr:tRNA dimethylallyltransferase 1 [Echinicola pacifica]
MECVPHYFVDNKSIFDDYDVRKFEKDALELLEKFFINQKLVIMTGGSGMYIDAICQGLDEIPEVDPQIRSSLNAFYQEYGLEKLQQKLLELDPEYYQEVDLKNPHRLIRACEVSIGTGRPFSQYRIKKISPRPFHIIKVGLERDREELYQRIDHRMDLMIADGLFEEAEKLYAHRHLNALQTVGYSEIFGFMEGKYNREEAIRLLKRNSRRYAKRQLTWFRKDKTIKWFHPDQYDQVLNYIQSQISS